jgi:hypothetical protein
MGLRQLGLQLADTRPQGGDLVLELQDAADSFDPDAGGRELRDGA